MIELKGKYTGAKIFTDLVDETAIGQIIQMINHKICEGTKVRFMPDVHAGKGATIGTTIQLPEDFVDWKVSPNIVGVDVGCAIMMYKLNDKDIDLKTLDAVVNDLIPAGFYVHDKTQDIKFSQTSIDNLTFDVKNEVRIHNSLGTLGGGNHFIELGKDGNDDYWLSVHSGSRGLGVQVAKHHQDIAVDNLSKSLIDVKSLIEKLKKEGRQREIQSTLMEIKKNTPKFSELDKEMAHLEGEDLKSYLHDMEIAQKFASRSREIMLNIIVKAMEFTVIDKFDSVHNFIEHDRLTNGIIRKGATSAKLGERLVIPLNMRDGSIIAQGKGNFDWNNSAPHGAGRMMSRNKAREELSLEDFKEQMKGVHSSSIGESTLDEAPGAYKPAQEIIDNIGDTVDILHIVKPVYNFKAK